jgi:cytochrome c556
MRSKAIYGLCAIALVAACREQQDAGQTNDLIRSAETRTGAAENISATPSGAPLGEPVSAEQAKTIMHERHEGMEEIGDAMKLVSRELKASNPDLARVRDGAATIARLAPQVSGWFPPGTGPDVGKTEAKAEIWQRPEDFAAKRDSFQTAAQRFNAAARGNDLAAIRAAHGELGKSCKACHDPYREEH